MDRGAHIEEKNIDGLTPIHCGALKGHTDTVKLLVDRGANIEEKDIDGNNPIHHAAEGGHTDTVKLLLDRGADPYITNEAGETARDVDKTG